MSTPDHLERYQALAANFNAATGRRLTSFIVIGVDERGEVYYGASIEPGREARALLPSIHQAELFARKQAAQEAA